MAFARGSLRLRTPPQNNKLPPLSPPYNYVSLAVPVADMLYFWKGRGQAGRREGDFKVKEGRGGSCPTRIEKSIQMLCRNDQRSLINVKLNSDATEGKARYFVSRLLRCFFGAEGRNGAEGEGERVRPINLACKRVPDSSSGRNSFGCFCHLQGLRSIRNGSNMLHRIRNFN